MAGNRPPDRILAIKLADLGDLLLCEPAFRSLRTAFPTARIDVLTNPSSVAVLDLIGHELHALPFPKHLFDAVSGLINPGAQLQAARLAIALRRARYDRVVVLHHLTTGFGAQKFAALVRATGCRYVAGLDNGRGKFLSHPVVDRGFGYHHEAAYMRDVAVAAGGATVGPRPVIAMPQLDDRAGVLPERFAAIFPATGPYSVAREWPAERFGEVSASLRQRGIVPVVVGGDDAGVAATTIRSIEPSAIDLSGRTTLPQLAGVLRRAQVVVGGDTFIGHLAAAVDTPVVSVFGPSNADAWRPAGSVDATEPGTPARTSLVVRQDLPCQPCIYTGFRLGRPAGCPDRTCLKLVSTADVERAVFRVLGDA
jgi:ADP-heptose:LPS heptosyltransferase